MPEKPEGTAAVAEAEETPPVESPPAIATPGEEAVPASEQEPSSKPEGEEPESGAPKVEDEAPTVESVRKAFLDRVEELRKSDPKLADEMAERFGKPAEDVDERLLNQASAFGKTQRQGSWQKADGAYRQYVPQAQERVVGILSELNDRVVDAAKQLANGRLIDADGNPDPEKVSLDPEGWAALITPLLTGAQGTAREMMAVGIQGAIQDTLEGHSAHRYLTGDERRRFQAAIAAGRYGEAISLHLDVAIRAAPEEFTKKAKAEAAEDAGLVEAFRKVTEGMPQNGQRSLTGDSKPSKPPETLEDINAALMNLETPVDKLPELQAKRAELLGR